MVDEGDDIVFIFYGGEGLCWCCFIVVCDIVCLIVVFGFDIEEE